MLMDKNLFSSIRLLFVTLSILLSILKISSEVTVYPQFACVGDTVTVNCSSTVPAAGDVFSALDANYIVGNDDTPIGPLIVNSNAMSGGVDLSKLTAVSVSGNSTFVEGRLILLSYLSEDNNVRLGCGNEYRINGNSANRAILRDTINLIQADPVGVSESTLRVKPNVNGDSFIFSGVYHDVSSVQRPDTLTYTLTLHFNGTTETLSSVPMSQVNSTAFTNKFLLDTYYRISVYARNCNGGSGSVDSKTFFLFGLKSCDECLDDIDIHGITRYVLTLPVPAGEFERDFLSRDAFNFIVENIDTNDMLNITDFNLNLPEQINFSLPMNYTIDNNNDYLKIYYNGELLAYIPIVVIQARGNAVMIILIVILVLLIVLFVIIASIIICFVIIHYKRKRDSEKT